MYKLVLAGVALAATAGAAFAQAPDAPPPQATPMAPQQGEAAPGGPGPREAMPGGPRGHHWKRGPHGMRDQGPFGGMRPTKGAMFVFDAGRGAGKIVIKCADEDSTQTCAEAVSPMLDKMLQARQSAE